MESKKTTIGNVCFIIDKQKNKILLLKRNREPMQNMFTGVGGKTNFEEDVSSSCIREAKEETGLDIRNIKLEGVVKTILDGTDSAWLLFIYKAVDFSGQLINCNEGELIWADLDDIYSYELIGFIREILPTILDEDNFLEGTIKHNIKGNVIDKRIINYET